MLTIHRAMCLSCLYYPHLYSRGSPGIAFSCLWNFVDTLDVSIQKIYGVEQKGVSFLKFYVPRFLSPDVATGIIFGSCAWIFARKYLKSKEKKGEGYQSLR